jgi:UDP-galactopyranose mutase
MHYDYLIVGAGLFGSVFAERAISAGKRVLVLEKRSHIGGNIYTEEVEGIQVHKYGAHIFHTNDKAVWDYINRFAQFNRYTNSPVANFHGELYSLPFNMYTFNRMWGVITPQEAEAEIRRQREAAGITEPQNLEEQAISLVGTDIYEKLVKGYTEKQWGRPCTELPPLSSVVCLSASHLTTTISMPASRVSPQRDTPLWCRSFSPVPMFS